MRTPVRGRPARTSKGCRTGENFVIDSRERAPAAATPTMFGNLDFGTASTSGVSVGVPGPLRGLEMALSRWGSMPLSRVIQPGIKLANGHGPRLVDG